MTDPFTYLGLRALIVFGVTHGLTWVVALLGAAVMVLTNNVGRSRHDNDSSRPGSGKSRRRDNPRETEARRPAN